MASKLSRLVHYAPLLAFVVLLLFLAIGLTLKPREVPSPLVGKPVPRFNLPPVKGRTLGLSSEDLKGTVSLVNVFASWCVACREEHPLLMELKRGGVVPIHGLNYKDRPEDAARWLDGLGDPYTRACADTDGRVAIDWGVYGVPETFVVDADGIVRFKLIGPMTREVLNQTILPLIVQLSDSKAVGASQEKRGGVR